MERLTSITFITFITSITGSEQVSDPIPHHRQHQRWRAQQSSAREIAMFESREHIEAF